MIPAIEEIHRPVTFVRPSKVNERKLLIKGIWVYFILLIIEGGLRKWGLPSLQAPLLIVRDPIAIWLIYKASKSGYLPSNSYLSIMYAVAAIGVLTAVTFGHGDAIVAIYGARVLILHFPLMFIMGRVLSREDVLLFGKAMLLVSIPMVFIIAAQFYSPQSAWINKGVGGEVELGFTGALGYSRPSGTFSFTTGITQFFSLLACFIAYFWLQPKLVNRILLQAATVCLLLAVPLSISRSLTFQIVLSCLFAVITIASQPKLFLRVMLAVFGVILAFFFLSNTSFFKSALGALEARFDNANSVEGGLQGTLIDRFLGGLLASVFYSDKQPLLGYGLGIGSNVGAKLLTGERNFLIAEGEWGRLIGELGFVLGLTVIYVRIAICVKIFRLALRQIKQKDILTWMLMSFGLITVCQSQWAQPSTLGFSTFIGGLMIASLKGDQKANS